MTHVDKLVVLLRTIDSVPRLALQIACCLPECTVETRRCLWLVLDDMRLAVRADARQHLSPLATMMGLLP